MRALAFAVLALVSVVGAVDKTLPAFTSVQVCTPFNVLIAPSTKSAQYSLSVVGDAAVLPAVSSAVKDGVLTLQSNGSFSTQDPVKVTVR